MTRPLFAALIVAEIVAFVAVAHATSYGIAIVLLLATSLVGTAIAKRTAVGAFRRMAEARRTGRPPDTPVADSAVAFAGAVLLAVPGFVTDALGLVAVFPPTRRLVRAVVGRRLATRMLRRGGWQVRPFGGRGQRSSPPPGPDVIEGSLDDRPDGSGPDGTTPR